MRFRFLTLFDMILIAMLVAVSIAFKTALQVLVKPLISSLGVVHAGAVLGGFYMLWLPLAILMTNKRGAALFLSALQALLLFAFGLPGSHGIWNIPVYILPGVAVELVYLIKPNKGYNIWHFIIAVISANIVGVITTNRMYQGYTGLALIVTLLITLLSGIIGGVIGDYVIRFVRKINVLERRTRVPSASKYLEDYDESR
jgi:hypothetical protein